MDPRERVASVSRYIFTSVCVLAGMVGQVRAAMYVVDQAAPGGPWRSRHKSWNRADAFQDYTARGRRSQTG